MKGLWIITSCMILPERVYVKHYHSDGRAPTTTHPVWFLAMWFATICLQSLKAHSESHIFLIISGLCFLLSSDRMPQTAHQPETAPPPAVASNLMFSRIKHAPPSPAPWRTSLQGWVTREGLFCFLLFPRLCLNLIPCCYFIHHFFSLSLSLIPVCVSYFSTPDRIETQCCVPFYVSL